MGMTTPFPEPDSPELRRLAVQSQPDVVELLRAAAERGLSMNVFFDAGTDFGVIALRDVDVEGEALVFEPPLGEGNRGRLLSAQLLTCVGFVDEIKLQFSSGQARAAWRSGRPVVALPWPRQVFRLERRGSVRRRLPGNRGATCRLQLPGAPGQYEALRVLDIGAGGIAVLTHPERVTLEVGMRFEACRLDLPGVGGFVVGLYVRHVDVANGLADARCCGCEFDGLVPAVREALARYVENRRNVGEPPFRLD